MRPTMEIFAENLTYYFAKNDVSQTDFANYVGVSMASVSEWLNGKKAPRFPKLTTICMYLGITYEDLFIDRTVPHETLTLKERNVINSFNSLPAIAQDKVITYLTDMEIRYEKEVD